MKNNVMRGAAGTLGALKTFFFCDTVTVMYVRNGPKEHSGFVACCGAFAYYGATWALVSHTYVHECM